MYRLYLATLLILLAPLTFSQFFLNKANATLYAQQQDSFAEFAIEVKIQPEWHLYHKELGPKDAVGEPTTLKLPSEVKWSETIFPKPHKLPQPKLGKGGKDTWIWSHEGNIVIYFLGEGKVDLEKIEITIQGLTCSKSGRCIPYSQTLKVAGAIPKIIQDKFPSDLEKTFTSGDNKATPEIQPENPKVSTEEQAKIKFPDYKPQTQKIERSFWIWMLFAFIAGVILNVMPCVLPVISIKVLSFVQQAGQDRKQIFLLGLSFSLGMMVVFWGLATVAVLFNLGWGDQFQSEIFKITILAIIFGFSLSLFGLYEIGVPAGVNSMSHQNKEGLQDAFFKGILATLLATPCSGPFLGTTLAWTLQQSTLVVFAIFSTLGFGMAFPYIILTANPKLLKILPRPGAWMETFKQLMGFILLATVVYLMASVRQDLLLFTNAFLFFIGVSCWYWGKYASLAGTKGKKIRATIVTLLIFAAGSYFSFVTFPGFYADKSAEGETAWEDFDAKKFLAYQEEGRNIFIDFTANWCPNCKWNEATVFNNEEVRAKMKAKDFVIIKADMTHDSPKTRIIQDLRNRLGASSIPFMAVFPADQPLEPHVRYDIVSKSDFLSIVELCP